MPEDASPEFIDLLEKLFRVSPGDRLTAEEILHEPFFAPLLGEETSKSQEDPDAQDHLRTTARSNPLDSQHLK